MVPPGLVLDKWHGSSYISLVGLRFARVRIFGVPTPQRAYDEVNLRFYVRREAIDGMPAPGVVFVRQLVPHRLTALAARLVYGEPFDMRPTGHRFSGLDTDPAALPSCVAYHWGSPGNRAAFWAESTCRPYNVMEGSLEDFLTRRYWGYNGKPGTRTGAYHLSRLDWQVRQTSRWGTDGDLSTICGGRFAETMRHAPASALLATGSRAAISLPERLSN